MALNIYGYRENNEMTPYQPNSVVDERQDREIATKADAHEVNEWIDTLFNEINSGLTIVAEQISGNTADIAELSGKIEDERAWVDEHYVPKDRMSAITAAIYDTIDELSTETKSEIDELWDAIETGESGSTDLDERVSVLEDVASGMSDSVSEMEEKTRELADAVVNLTGQKADICWVEENFATKDEVAEMNDILTDAINTNSENISANTEAISNEIERSTNADAELDAKLDEEKSERENADSAFETALATEKGERIAGDTNLEEKISTEHDEMVALHNEVVESLGTERTERIAADDELGSRIDSITSDIEERLDEDETKFNEFSATTNEKISTQQVIIETLRAEVSGKADAADVLALSDRVSDVEDALDSKADKTDFDALVDDVDTLAENVETRATKEALNELREDVTELTVAVDGKAEQSDLSTLTDEVTDFKDDVTANYLTKTEANELYPVKSSVVLKSEFDDKIDEIESIVNAAASKADLVSEVTERAAADEQLSNRITSLSETLSNRVGNVEGNVNALSETVSAHAEAIDKNRTDIGLISELKTTEGGGYDDSGNGILDVLHREFHKLYNYHSGLTAYIESLEERIQALENKE
jgi:macrodomain Ter protein organizer (MatP/YcbG family)